MTRSASRGDDPRNPRTPGSPELSVSKGTKYPYDTAIWVLLAGFWRLG
jgi:hypothetical protein